MQQPISPILNDGGDERSPLANDTQLYVFCKQGSIGIGNNQSKSQTADHLLQMRQTQHSNNHELLSNNPAIFQVPVAAKGPAFLETPVGYTPIPTVEVATISKEPLPTE